MNMIKVSGRSISINNGVVTIDGKVIKTGDEKVINITIEGNCEQLSADACSTITVGGVTGSVNTMTGNVKCGDVGGSVTTMSGDVKVAKAMGSVSTMSGDIS